MTPNKIVALAGGVGGAKLADGLARLLPPQSLTTIVNVGDDFSHYGFHICPDLDTVMYTLSKYANPATGWGVRDETWQMLAMLQTYGEDPWFRLGDRDLGTHVLRRHLLDQGQTLTQITTRFCQQLGIKQTILPASDDRFATMLETTELGTLPFQEYFVRHRWQSTVERIWYDGADTAQPSAQVLAALESASAIVICPSNPILSIDPILSIGDLRQRVTNRRVPCVAISPLINGQAVKGPTAQIMPQMGYAASTDGIIKFYDELIDCLFVAQGDVPQRGTVYETDIMMPTVQERQRLAQEVLNYLER